MMLQIAIIQFPGSNCERETRMAVERTGMEAIDVPWYSQFDLNQFHGFIIIGGFSYEDRGRAGFVAAQDSLMEQIAEQADLGKPVLGICNGAQILVESGLVPGLENRGLGAALTINKRIKHNHVLGVGYYNTWCYMKPSQVRPNSVFGRYFKEPIHIPLAHADGRFVIPDYLLQELEQAGGILWQYCDAQGNVDSHFPVNPNGSVNNLAALSNPAGNVLAVMPHPERTRNGDGIFKSMCDYINEGELVDNKPLKTAIEPYELTPYRCPEGRRQVIVEQLVPDNEAMTLQKALHQKGFHYQVKRLIHWQIETEELESGLLDALIASNELHNPLTESIITEVTADQSYYYNWLVRDEANIKGLHKLEVLQQKCNLPSIRHVCHSVIWQITADDPELIDAANALTRRHFFFNPFAHECYRYE